MPGRLVRVVAGLFLMPHGAQKLFGWFGAPGLAGVAGFFGGKLGLEPAMFWAVVVAVTEAFGGLALMLGFLTRAAALAVFVLMFVIVFAVHMPNGFFWANGGYEYPMMWGLIALAIALRGVGPLSVDTWIGREL